MGLYFALRCHLAIVIVHVVNCSANIQESLNKLLLIFLSVMVNLLSLPSEQFPASNASSKDINFYSD